MIETLGTSIGSYAPDFELPGTDGSVHHLADYLKNQRAIAVVFICNGCPYVNLYLDRLKQLQAEFHDQGFLMIGLNPNDEQQFPQDRFEQMKPFAAKNQLNFLYLRDVTQDVAETFGATKTPHAFLIDQAGVLRYSGAIDDNAENPKAVKRQYLREAIAQVLKGQSPSPASTKPIGGSVKWRAS